MALGKNKALQYIIIGVPLLIGGYFVFKAIKNSRSKSEEIEGEETPETPQGNTGNGGVGVPPPNNYPQKDSLPFKKGSGGTYVQSIQSKLGITSDGKFGTQTYNAVVKYQKANGLVADGIVGAKTWRSLFGADFPSVGVASGTISSLKPQTTLSQYATSKYSTDPNYWS